MLKKLSLQWPKAFMALLLMKLLVPVAYAVTNSSSGDRDSSEASTVINRMVQAINNQDSQEYISCFSKENRGLMERFIAENPDQTFFKEQNATLVNIRELPKEFGVASGGLVTRDQSLDRTRFFYAEIRFKVNREEKWLYNGINHRLIVMTEETDGWKIAGIPVPSIRVLVESGYGFRTEAEKKAVEIEATMEARGLVTNYEGRVIANLAASEADLAKEKQTDLSIIPEVSPTATDEHARPSSIKVYLTYQTNKDYWKTSTATVNFYDYIRDVLPNEWVASWYTSYPTAVRAGALAVKMYGWYHVYHPKWNFSPYYADVQDNTNDQKYIVNSRHSSTTQAISDVGGIGVDRADGNLFETQHIQGSENDGGYHGGKMWHFGTKYWAGKGKGYTFMVHYYYDYSTNTANQLAHFFYY
jgi:hypothetical protein